MLLSLLNLIQQDISHIPLMLTVAFKISMLHSQIIQLIQPLWQSALKRPN